MIEAESTRSHDDHRPAAAAAQPLRVRDAMLRAPTVHDATASVASMRTFFLDDHVHMALLVDRGRLIATVERRDLAPARHGGRPACSIGAVRGRTIDPDVSLDNAARAMRLRRRRRLAVVDDRGTLLGLLCLKANGDGFCSEQDVYDRAQARASRSTGVPLRNGDAPGHA